MSPDLQLDPDGLRMAAGRAETALAALAALPPLPGDLVALAGLPDGATLVAEHDRLVIALSRAQRELGELASTLRTVASRAEAMEQEARRVAEHVVEYRW